MHSPRLLRTLLTSRQEDVPADHPFDKVIIIPPSLIAYNGGRSEKLTRTLSYHLTCGMHALFLRVLACTNAHACAKPVRLNACG